MSETIHIRAVEGARVMLVKSDGSVRPGRFAGCTADGKMIPSGEDVLDHGHYHRQAARGDLVIDTPRVVAPPAIAPAFVIEPTLDEVSP